MILSSALAEIVDSNITTTSGDVRVHAENLSQIDAETLNSIQSAGEGAGVTLAFNSIGWKSQNILFNLIDTILGDPLIATAFGNADPAETTALIHNSRIASHGNLEVSAINESLIYATVSNKAETTVVVITGSTSLAVGVAIASNMINAKSSAGVEFDSTGAYTLTTLPAQIQPGDRIAVAPGKVYEYTGSSPRAPPATAAGYVDTS